MDSRAPADPPWLAAVVARLRRRRRIEAAEEALPAWLDGAARAVRSGASLRLALEQAAEVVVRTPLAPATDELAACLARGGSLSEALAAFGPGSAPPGRRLAARSLSLAALTGGASASLLDAVAATARHRLALRREAWALSTQARWSAWVIGAAPAAFAALAAGTDGRVASFLVGTPLGWACLLCGLALDGAGLAWMAHLVRGVVR